MIFSRFDGDKTVEDRLLSELAGQLLAAQHM